MSFGRRDRNVSTRGGWNRGRCRSNQRLRMVGGACLSRLRGWDSPRSNRSRALATGSGQVASSEAVTSGARGCRFLMGSLRPPCRGAPPLCRHRNDRGHGSRRPRRGRRLGGDASAQPSSTPSPATRSSGPSRTTARRGDACGKVSYRLERCKKLTRAVRVRHRADALQLGQRCRHLRTREAGVPLGLVDLPQEQGRAGRLV